MLFTILNENRWPWWSLLHQRTHLTEEMNGQTDELSWYRKSCSQLHRINVLFYCHSKPNQCFALSSCSMLSFKLLVHYFLYDINIIMLFYDWIYDWWTQPQIWYLNRLNLIPNNSLLSFYSNSFITNFKDFKDFKDFNGT